MLQAVLLSSSLVLVLGMCVSLMWLAAARMREAAEARPAKAPDERAEL